MANANELAENDELIEEQEEIIDPPDIDSKYRLIILAAQRSKQLQRGANPRVDADIRRTKPTRIALSEFEGRKVNFSFREEVSEKAEPSEAGKA